jgi:predicted transcriptional regulator
LQLQKLQKIKMAKKRERLEIIRDILNTIQRIRNVRHTKLLHHSNLSPQMFKEYMSELLQKDFVEKKESGKIKYFVLKNKGAEFLMEYLAIDNLIKNFGL